MAYLSLETLPLWHWGAVCEKSSILCSNTTCCCLVFGHRHVGGSTTALWFWLVFLWWSMTITIFLCPYWLPVWPLRTNAQSDPLFFILFPFVELGIEPRASSMSGNYRGLYFMTSVHFLIVTVLFIPLNRKSSLYVSERNSLLDRWFEIIFSCPWESY